MPFDFSAVVAPFRMQPGLRRMPDGAHHLTPSRLADRALAAKRAVLTSHASQAVLVASAFDAAPALHALASHAANEHPDALQRRTNGGFTAPLLGCSVDGNGAHVEGPADLRACLVGLPASLRLAGLLSLAFVEDFAVLDGNTGRVPLLAVCLPSSWAPEDKVGLPFTAIHAPVADNAALLAAARPLVELTTAGGHWERHVWTFTPDDRLDRHPARAPHAGWNPTADAAALAATTFLRSERQTFIPLGTARQAAFTIRVEVEPLVHAVRTRAEARQLHAALSTMSAEVLRYRALTPAQSRLLQWLETVNLSDPA